MLEAIVENPRTPISKLPILTEAEQTQMIREWNQTAMVLPASQSIQELLEEQARKQPDALAIVTPHQSLSYQELDQKANRIAAHLRNNGLPAKAKVALCANRSAEMMIGIWGILKAGGAYIPLDPEYPAERIQFMLEDAEVGAVLTQQKHLERFADQTEAMLLSIESLLEKEVANPADPMAFEQEHPAYIIYTSGSTGRPKGVLVSHRNLLHSTQARFHYYPDQPQRFLLMSSFAFDSSVVGIFWTLCSGGTLVLPPDRIEQDMSQLAELIAKESVTIP